MIDIIYEEEDFLVLDKPSGLVVHPDDNYDKEDTLVGKLLKLRPEIEGVGEDESRPGIVHRLDKGTSGVLVVAKTEEVFKKLKELFKERQVKKTYLALVHGEVDPQEGEIDCPIYLSPDHFPKREALKDKKRRGDIKTTIRNAESEYKLLKKINGFSLCEVYPKTGRTHQIRVHLKAISHPVVGDDLYRFKDLEKPPGLKRIFLHAKRISFRLKGNLYEFESKLPAELVDFLDTLDD